MLDSNAIKTLVPSYSVQINGANVSSTVQADLISVAVHQDVQAPDMFTLELVNWDLMKVAVTWSDDDLFAAGVQVQIQMGYVDNLQTLMAGEITGLEPSFSADEVPTLTVRGHDGRHRLLRGNKTRSFTQVKDSDIASQVASSHNLTAQVTDTRVTLDYVLQNNQTDWEFLQERARRIGYEVVVQDKTLYFRPHQNSASAALTLTRDQDLIEFYPRLTTMTQVGQTAVRGWSIKDKAAITAQAVPGDVTANMGGRTTGPSAANNAFGQTEATTVNRPVFSQAEADQIAKGQLNNLSLAYITGEGVCIGRTDLRAGQVIRIDGLGKRFSGLYYVTTAIHTCSPRRGYLTAFTVRRDAA